MPLSTSFAQNFSEARGLFLEAATAAGGCIDTYVHPMLGPNNEKLATDTVWLGPNNAESVVVVLSGTHGVEGFCGSGAQVEFLRRKEIDNYPPSIGVLLVHAVNPFGFAWIRRVNEDNIDLNRNWVDFDTTQINNQAYERLRSAICPKEWNDECRIECDKTLVEYANNHGYLSLQAAISGGQWNDPAGVFYGGNCASWSRRTQSSIFEKYLARRRRVAILDMHTGLGSVGFCERILTVPSPDAAGDRAKRWFGPGLSSPSTGTSTSAPIRGDGLSHAVRTLNGVEVAAIALEYGTVPISQMLDAVRADAWLHTYGDLNSPKGKIIKGQLRDAFYVDDDIWRGMVLGQFLLTARQAAMAMSDSRAGDQT